MTEFFKLKTPQEVLSLLKTFGPVDVETAHLTQAMGRVLAEDIAAPHDIPSFHRSSMDGYAVRARDTFGASENLPAFLSVVGEVKMGENVSYSLESGQTAKIWTGGMLPKGADAVVMIEYAHALDEETVELAKAVSPLENVIQPGDDVHAGTVLLRKGSVLRPQDLGLLAGLGIAEVSVYRRLSAAVISTGDELIGLDDPVTPGSVRDMNSYSLGGLLSELGVTPVYLGVAKDHFGALRDKVEQGLAQADVVLLSGGSSVGARDYTVEVFKDFPGTEILVHGISIKPGKPTILAKMGHKAVWGLPGHAVSAMIIFSVFVRPLLRIMSGFPSEEKNLAPVVASLERNLESAPGREEYIRVKIINSERGLTARPILGKSGLISTMVEADGLIRIPMEAEGLYQGDRVEVVMFNRCGGAFL